MTEPPHTIRAFIAIELPSEVRSEVERTQRALKSTIPTGLIRWTPPEQIHLTLKFLGNIPADSAPELETALRRACTGMVPFELCAEGLGGFPDLRRPRVLWIGVGGALDALQQLQAAIARETDRWGEREERAFHPHLTWGRVRTTRKRELDDLGAAIRSVFAARWGSWRVTRVDLMRSELDPDGARHCCLATVPLAA